MSHSDAPLDSPRPSGPPVALDGLQGVSRTLLLPLFARAHAAALVPHAAHDFVDTVAQEATATSPLTLKDVSRDLFPMRLCVARTLLIEDALKGWLAQAPDRKVLLLACGLDTLPQRLASQGIASGGWLCADLPEVMGLREQLLPPTEAIQHATISLPAQLHAIGDVVQACSESNPPIVIMEGVLPYLSAEDVAQSLAYIVDHCPSGTDLLVDSYHPSLLSFAQMGATFRKLQVGFRFGLSDPREYEQLTAGLSLQRAWDVFGLIPWYHKKRCLFPRLVAGRRPLATVTHLRASCA